MPLTRMQREYLANCTHRYNVKCGATGSGKSYVDIAVTIPQRLLAMRGEGLAVMIGNTRSTLERNILEPMRSLYSEDNRIQDSGRHVRVGLRRRGRHVERRRVPDAQEPPALRA